MPIIKDASQTCIPGFQSDSEVLPRLSLEWRSYQEAMWSQGVTYRGDE